MSDFYEDDEPLEQVLAAWENGPHGLTGHYWGHWTTTFGQVNCEIWSTSWGEPPTFCGQRMEPR